jgi:hypothetical protein
MTTRLILLLAAALLCWAAPLQGQTIKSLGVNTTNGQVVSPTNALTFTNRIVLPSDANHAGTTALALQISTNNTGFYVSTSTGNAFVMTHLGSVGLAVQTNAINFFKPLRYNATSVGATNAPANTTNRVLWLEVQIGTNSYRAPLYQ